MQKNNGDSSKEAGEVSSCAITANFRSRHPEVSGDSLSGLLVTAAEDKIAQAFIDKYNYPLASRKIAVLAGFFLKHATGVLATGNYDSCISFASGLSMLLYLIKTQKSTPEGVQFIDSDVADVMAVRESRIAAMSTEMGLDSAKLASIKTMVFDIEQAFKEGRSLKEVFPDCKKPLFILDGVSYFLSEACVEWLMEQMAGFDQSAVMLYYWPDDMSIKSVCFKDFAGELGNKDFIEKIVSFWGDETKRKFAETFPGGHRDMSLGEVEFDVLSGDASAKFTHANRDKFFHVRVAMGEQPQ